jgi:hypothetical protein
MRQLRKEPDSLGVSDFSVTSSREYSLVRQELDSIAKMDDVGRLYRLAISGLPINYKVGALPLVHYMAQMLAPKCVDALISLGADVHEKLASGNILHSLLTTADNRKIREIHRHHSSPTDLAVELMSIFFEHGVSLTDENDDGVMPIADAYRLAWDIHEVENEKRRKEGLPVEVWQGPGAWKFLGTTAVGRKIARDLADVRDARPGTEYCPIGKCACGSCLWFEDFEGDGLLADW